MHQPELSGNNPSPGQDRRSFLKTSLGGALFLGSVSLTAGLTGCATAPAGGVSDTRPGQAMDNDFRYRFLSQDDIVLFEALLPAIVGPALPEDPELRRQRITDTIRRVDAGIVQFGAPNQQELRKLFDLLNLGLTRVTVARVWSRWENASTTEVNAFLERWRNSGFGLLNNGYMALIKLSNVAFYGHRDNWHLAGYPGPQGWAMKALPQFTSPAGERT